MIKSIRVITKKKRGRPISTGKGTLIGVRLLDGPLSALDTWIEKQEDPDLSRPEAIRRLVETGLTMKAPAKAASNPGRKLRAQELATSAIERIIDPSAPADERAQRRRRLTKGPEEFREVRVDKPKARPKG